MNRFQEIERHPFDDDGYLKVIVPRIISEVAESEFSLIVTNKKLFRLALEKGFENKNLDVNLIDQNTPLETGFLKGHVYEIINRFKQMGVIRDLSKSTNNTECFFANLEETTLYRAITVLKKIEQNGIEQATLSNLMSLLDNSGGVGRKIVTEFRKLPVRNEEEYIEVERISLWFFNDYFTGMSGERWTSKTYDYTSNVRSRLNQLIACLNSEKAFIAEQLTPIKKDGMKGVFVLDVSGIQTSEINFILQEFNNAISQNKSKSVLVWDVFGSDLNLTETKTLLLNAHNVKVFSFKESQLVESIVAKEDVSEEKLWFYQKIEEENSRQLTESFEEIDFEEAHKEYLLSLENSKKQMPEESLEEFELLDDFDDDFNDSVVEIDSELSLLFK